MGIQLSDIQVEIKRLTDETSGLRGEVLKRSRPEVFEAKMAELRHLTHQYFHYFYAVEHSTLP